LTGN